MGVRNIKKQLAGEEDLLLGEGIEQQERHSGIKNITKLRITKVVATIEDMLALDTSKYLTCNVTDKHRGGVFQYDANRVAENDEGTVFNGWVRGDIFGLLKATWFGAKLDADFSSKSGSDDTQAIKNAIEAASRYGLPVLIDAYGYCTKQIDIPMGVKLVGTGHYSSGLRVKHSKNESSVVLKGSGSGVVNMEIQAHCYESRDANSGHLGNCVRVGDFFTTEAHQEITDFEIDILATRTQSTDDDYSDSAPAVNTIGNVSGGKVKLRLKGGDTTGHSIGYQAHWGGYNSNANPEEEPIKTYHPNNIDVDIIGDIENCNVGVVLSSTWNMSVSDFRITQNTWALLVLPGDNINKYAEDSVKDNIFKGLRIGHISSTDIGDVDSSSETVLVSGRGTSKWDKYSGTDVFVQHQLEIDLIVDGMTLTSTNGKKKGCRLTGVNGNVKLGHVDAFDYVQSSIEEEYCFAHSLYSVGGNSPFRYEYSRGGTISGVNVEMPIDGYSPCYLTGDIRIYTLDGNFAAGATEIKLTSVLESDVKVHEGQTITIGTQTVTATGVSTLIDTLFITPLPNDVSDGDTVSVYRLSEPTEVTMNSIGGNSAIKANGANTKLKGQCQGTGKMGLQAESLCNIQSNMQVVGNGQRGDDNKYYDYFVGDGCNVSIHNPIFDKNKSNCIAHLHPIGASFISVIGGKCLSDTTDTDDGNGVTSDLIHDSTGTRHQFYGLVDADNNVVSY